MGAGMGAGNGFGIDAGIGGGTGDGTGLAAKSCVTSTPGWARFNATTSADSAFSLA